MEKKVLTVVVSILIALLGWLGSIQYAKLTEISKEIVSMKLELVQLQKDILTWVMKLSLGNVMMK